ncbi:DoxX family protein [Saccharothrix sp. NPDC042600]|uniref:DoxX family protein n=1 Tax=Saccharothrix TaxID=2071 RepID=UPI0033E4A70B
MSDQTASVPVKVGNVVVWALQLALAAYFLYSGWLLFGEGFVKKFDDIGFGQWLRYVTGALEIAGALGLLLPRLCGVAALGLFGVMVGAVSTELFILDSARGAQLPAVLGLVALVVAVLRRDTVKALAAQVFGK